MRDHFESGVASADESFARAFDALYPTAVRLAMRIVGDQSTAEDVAAEAMARTYARWAKVSALPYRDAWVLKVTGNLAIDSIRRKPPLHSLPLTNQFEDGAALRLALAAALGHLPTRQRESVVLRYLAGYTDAEVSVALGISPNSVKKHVQRGLAALRANLKEMGGGVHVAV
ncbi:MAG: RNA polymerase sigma factor [Acidimicrobiales bacterium]